MIVRLHYGRDGLEVRVPDTATVLHMTSAPPLAAPDAQLAAQLDRPIGAAPLRQLAQGKRTACILISDITRPVPNELLVSALLRKLHAAGVAKSDVTILVATGIHRAATDDELIEMLGEPIVRGYHIVSHDARDANQQGDVGETANGTPVRVNKLYLAADLKIATGLIEPHLMAGFSGGRKSVCPGICSLDTVKVWHSPKFLESPQAREGCIAGNPVHDEALEIAQMAGVDFIVNAVLNEKREIVGIFAGDLVQAHAAGVEQCRKVVAAPIDEPFDVVVTTSAGYPLDTTFYQSIKGMTAALAAVKPGGTIILAAGMRQGVGGPEFTQLCRNTTDLGDFMHRIEHTNYFVTDQWQLEELVRAKRHADVWVYTDGLSQDALADLFVKPLSSVEAGIEEALRRHGPSATLAIIPEGPYVLPVVRGG